MLQLTCNVYIYLAATQFSAKTYLSTLVQTPLHHTRLAAYMKLSGLSPVGVLALLAVLGALPHTIAQPKKPHHMQPSPLLTSIHLAYPTSTEAMPTGTEAVGDRNSAGQPIAFWLRAVPTKPDRDAQEACTIDGHFAAGNGQIKQDVGHGQNGEFTKGTTRAPREPAAHKKPTTIRSPYIIRDGKLYQNGGHVSTNGKDANQRFKPSSHELGINTGFAIVNDRLTWRNAAFRNDDKEATFCRQHGKYLYVVFTRKPFCNCEDVDLMVLRYPDQGNKGNDIGH